jgi:hypothetical protein
VRRQASAAEVAASDTRCFGNEVSSVTKFAAAVDPAKST